MKSLCEKYQAKKINNESFYLTACPQDKFLPAHSTPMPITYTGLNMLTNNLCFLSNKQGTFLVFFQRIAIRYQAVKNEVPFRKKPQTLQKFLEENKFCWSRQEELIVYCCI